MITSYIEIKHWLLLSYFWAFYTIAVITTILVLPGDFPYYRFTNAALHSLTFLGGSIIGHYTRKACNASTKWLSSEYLFLMAQFILGLTITAFLLHVTILAVMSADQWVVYVLGSLGAIITALAATFTIVQIILLTTTIKTMTRPRRPVC